MKLLKNIFSTFILFFTLSAYSAPSDCVQLEQDGTVNCIPALTYFSLGNSPKFQTSDELVSYVMNNIICNSYIGAYECYAQYKTSPFYPPIGREICSSSPVCGKFIDYSPNQTQNGFSIVATILRNTEPYYFDKHFQRSVIGYRSMLCPANTTAINVGGETTPFQRWCKPINLQFEPSSCDNGCNFSSGNSSY